MKSWWKAILTYPPTWIALALLVLITWIFISVLDLPGLLIVILIALLVIAVVSWPLTMSATGTLTRLQFEVPRVEEVDPAALARLSEELSELEDPQPAEQLEALQQKRESLTRVLQRRLDAGEMTYARYLATAQDVYVSALDNLHEVAVAYESISTIDEDYIDRRLTELDTAGEHDEVSERERESLEGRRELRRSQEKKIAGYMAQNEAAMTGLDRTTTALADAPIGKTPEDAEAAMEALAELADRASKYAQG